MYIQFATLEICVYSRNVVYYDAVLQFNVLLCVGSYVYII